VTVVRFENFEFPVSGYYSERVNAGGPRSRFPVPSGRVHTAYIYIYIYLSNSRARVSTSRTVRNEFRRWAAVGATAKSIESVKQTPSTDYVPPETATEKPRVYGNSRERFGRLGAIGQHKVARHLAATTSVQTVRKRVVVFRDNAREPAAFIVTPSRRYATSESVDHRHGRFTDYRYRDPSAGRFNPITIISRACITYVYKLAAIGLQ